MKKICDLLGKVFSYGVLITLFAGALAGVGFVIAFLIGGSVATELCVFIHKTYFPVVIKMCSISTGCGLLNMYLGKSKALTIQNSK